MFGVIGQVFGWIFQAIVTTVVVDWVANYLRRRREQAEAAKSHIVTVERPVERQLPQP
jgi:hypothetical protein